MKSGCFRVSAKSECVSTYILWPNYMPKTDGRATVIGNENVYTNSNFRGGIERHQTNWTYLLPGSEWLYLDEPSLNLASKNTNVSSSQCFWIAHFEKFEMCEVKQRATVQDSCLSNYYWRNDKFKYPQNNEEGDSTLNGSSIWGAHPAARGYLSSSLQNEAAYFWFLKNERELVFSHKS